MKFTVLILSVFFSAALYAQPTVSVATAPAADTIIIIPASSVTLTGTAVRANPGHPILDTTWTQSSGPSAATITNPSNRMTTTVTGLVVGTYVFTLTATDKNNSASANLTVRVLSGILPIQFAYFKATHNDQGIVINWQTNTESNSAFFVIQQSLNGAAFRDIQIIHSKAKNGNSSIPLSYSYQIPDETRQAGMENVFLAMTIVGLIAFMSTLNRTAKYIILALASLFFFSCSKSVEKPGNAPDSIQTAYRLKIVNLDNQVSYSEIKMIN